MSNKLYYRLGLEDLQVVDEVRTPVVELQGSQLEADQLHHELQEDTNRLDALHADTKTMEEVQMGLEAALKNASVDRNALSFAQKAVQMVDRRWGFGYPIPSMEGDDDMAVGASMEDGIGQRLKDMGKALLEMLKKIWAKLKEWGGKLLQALGLKKELIKQVEERAERIVEVAEGKIPLTPANVAKASSPEVTKPATVENKEEPLVKTPVPSATEVKQAAVQIQQKMNINLRKCEFLRHNGFFPKSVAEMEADLQTMREVMKLRNVHDDYIASIMNEVKRLKPSDMDDMSAWYNAEHRKFQLPGFTDTDVAQPLDAKWGRRIGYKPMLPGFCNISVWLATGLGGHSMSYIELLRNPQVTKHPALVINDIHWIGWSEVLPLLKEVDKLVDEVRKSRRAETMFEKLSEELFDYWGELDDEVDKGDRGEDVKLLKKKARFVYELANSYGQHGAEFTLHLNKYFDDYTSALVHYLDICGDFWGEYMFLADGLKKVSPKWRSDDV